MSDQVASAHTKGQALADYPAAIFPTELMTAYPEAAVILSVRSDEHSHALPSCFRWPYQSACSHSFALKRRLSTNLVLNIDYLKFELVLYTEHCNN